MMASCIKVPMIFCCLICVEKVCSEYYVLVL